MEYGIDIIDGIEVPQLVITEDFTIHGEHNGTVHVERGTLTIQGELNGTLDVQENAKVVIIGEQNGTVNTKYGTQITVHGEINGTTTIGNGSLLIIEEGGKLAGCLNNNGKLILRGVFGGPQNGNGKLVIEGNGYIKKPVIKNGISYYEW